MRHTQYKDVNSVDFRGLTIRDLTPGALASASVAEVEIAPGMRHPRSRSSRSDKLYVCVEGQVSFHVAEDEITLNLKDVLVVPKGEWFSYENRTKTISRVFLVHLPPFDITCEEFPDD